VGARLEGGCACGEIRYRLLSEPLFVHCCHCLNCQRQTGSAFVINILIETDRIELLAGEPQPVDVPRSSGTQRIFRCPTCQIDDPSAVAPDVHIYTRSKLPWVTLPEGVPAFRTYYDPEKLWPAESLERIAALRRK
jgi:hypothetical protein